MHWIGTIADPAQPGSMTEVSKKVTTHQNDKHEDGKEVKGAKLPSQAQLSKQNDIKIIPAQWIDTTPDPVRRRSITEVLNKELTYKECDKHEEEGGKRDKIPPQNHKQQKTSGRRKMIPHTRTDDFLRG